MLLSFNAPKVVLKNQANQICCMMSAAALPAHRNLILPLFMELLPTHSARTLMAKMHVTEIAATVRPIDTIILAFASDIRRDILEALSLLPLLQPSFLRGVFFANHTCSSLHFYSGMHQIRCCSSSSSDSNSSDSNSSSSATSSS